jgi:hypothetical protein
MSVSSFIPTIWSASVLRNFERASVYASCLSRDYAGELKSQGDTVKVPVIGAVAVRPYARNQNITYDLATGSTIDITINNCNYFALKCDDLDKTQAAPNFLAAATKSGGFALRDAVDVDCGLTLAAAAGTKLHEDEPFNSLTLAGAVIDLLSRLSTALDENDIPRADRWCVLPPFLANKLNKELIGVTVPDTQIVSEAWLSRCFGFDIYMSNNVPKNAAGNYLVLAGVKQAGTLITQIENIEAMRDPNSFADLVRGIMLWQSAALLPSGIVSAAVTDPAAPVEP